VNELGGTRPPDQPEQAKPAETQAPAGQREARPLAEPRSRAEVAAEARANAVRHDERPQADGRGTVAPTPAGRQDKGSQGETRQEHADGHDRLSPRVRAVQADRTIGDTTPAGIGLKPDGEQFRDMEGDRVSRGDRFRKAFYTEVGDIQDAGEKTASDVAAMFARQSPGGHAETATQPAIEASHPPPLDAGNIATAGLVVGLLADRVIHLGIDVFRRSKG
jgi:hypothetical protein